MAQSRAEIIRLSFELANVSFCLERETRAEFEEII